jgi:hypothetical protein
MAILWGHQAAGHRTRTARSVKGYFSSDLGGTLKCRADNVPGWFARGVINATVSPLIKTTLQTDHDRETWASVEERVREYLGPDPRPTSTDGPSTLVRRRTRRGI